MEIRHATLETVRKGRDGRRVLVTGDVLGVVAQLQQIDPRLRVFWNEYAEYYVIVEELPDGSESLVTTIPPDGLNSQLVEYVRMLGSMKYDYIGNAEKADREAEKAKTHEFEEKIGEIGEEMAHKIRRDDVEYSGKAFVPKDINFGKDLGNAA
jgi:hypothetical protein